MTTNEKLGIPSRPGRTRADKQLSELQLRQHELKQAALTAKKDGDLELARTYLRQAKGIEPLIQASIGGLPVDMNSVPVSPLAKVRLDELSDAEEFTTIEGESIGIPEEGSDDKQIYENMEKQLVKQIKVRTNDCYDWGERERIHTRIIITLSFLFPCSLDLSLDSRSFQSSWRRGRLQPLGTISSRLYSRLGYASSKTSRRFTASRSSLRD